MACHATTVIINALPKTGQLSIATICLIIFSEKSFSKKSILHLRSFKKIIHHNSSKKNSL